MPIESDKIMFEVYRETGFDRRYKVVFYTELDEHDRDAQIGAAFAGEHFYDGFVHGGNAAAAKEVLSAFVGRLNSGFAATAEELEALLSAFLVK
jgi:hypothetical protein